MKLRTGLSVGLVVVSTTASAVLVGAAGFTERLQTERMTVLSVDRTSGRFQCAEHHAWMAVGADSLSAVQQGDIVKLEKAPGQRGRLVVVRTASEELSSVER
jgi:hypothetical protein